MAELSCAACGQFIADGQPVALLYAGGELYHLHPAAPCVEDPQSLRAASPCRRCGRERMRMPSRSFSYPVLCPPCRSERAREAREQAARKQAAQRTMRA